HERGGRRADCDADGHADGGVVGGENTYGLGVLAFLARLRERLGPGRLVTADGHSGRHQRGFGLLNGIESEGWPHLRDRRVTDFSGGLNRHAFWAARGAAPVFNYVNHKFVEPTGQPGRPNHRPEVPWSIHRLVLAAAVMTDSAVCYSYAPPAEPGESLGIWDELVRGRDRQVGWLGRPTGPARHLALDAPDAFGGAGDPPGEVFCKRLSGKNLRFAAAEDGVRVAQADGETGPIKFRLAGIPCRGPDLVVRVTMRAAPLPGYPERMARLAHVGIAPPQGKPVRYITWVDGGAFTSYAYFSEIRSKTVDLALEVEGGEPVWITRVTAHAAPDALVRLFERGVVLANPSPRRATFDLKALAPGRQFCRLRGSSRQDPETNSGEPVGQTVTLGPKDALFLVDAEAPEP
ncbi:MAG: hypothetical protein U9R68_09490, partial [Planctomycetota bacterium]|nr:hypothetical protein [Planctomycetota bacterium]